MVGGLGICGRPFCCASFLDDFQPVSIKMAKTQNLSLNPTKISGTCGRLMCCLKYEQDAYEDLIRTSPKLDSFVDTPEGRGTVVELDLLRQRVKVRMEDSPETVSLFPNSDVAVLRSGKARKNDPPIPADLAPISGGGKRVRREAQEETMVLEPIRFKYSTETIVEETPAAPEAVSAQEAPAPAPGAEAADTPKPSRSRRRRGRGEGGKTTAPAPADAPKDKTRPPKPPKEGRNPEKNAEPRQSPAPRDAAGEKSARRPNNHRRSRKPRAQGDGNKGSAE